MNLMRILKFFCFSVVLVFCVTLLVIGVLAAGENTRAITFGQDTDMLVINQTAEGISLNKNDTNIFKHSGISKEITENALYAVKFITPPLSSNSMWMIKSISECISYYFS